MYKEKEELLINFKNYWNFDKIYINEKTINNLNCELVDQLEYIKLDVNRFNDYKTNNSRFSAIFGNIIKSKNCKKNIYGYNSLRECYGILISNKDIENIKTLLQDVSEVQWDLFGRTFNSRYVYIFNEDKLTHERLSWNDFYEFKNL